MALIAGARYAHTNLVARDWRALAAFYERVFGCVPIPPERDYAGPELEAGTGVSGAALRGVHLRLPGAATRDSGPTLEIFTYAALSEAPEPRIDRPGFAHVAFEVADVAAAREAVLTEGGSEIGEIVASTTADGREVTWCYVRDPEGNAIELQAWAPAAR